MLNCASALTSFGGIFDLAEKESRLEELDDLMAAPDIWNDQEKSTALGRERTRIQGELTRWRELTAEVDEAEVALELMREEADEALAAEAAAHLDRVEKGLREMEFQKMLSGPNDASGAILAINSGAGGLESQDWAEMLLRMYTRWGEQRGYAVDVVDRLDDDEGGIKSATVTFTGRYAYGYLKAETGVHRLVRISPFDANARRHTSFASVAVLPDLEDEESVAVEEKDLKIDVFRASGAGGQHVNKTESAVRVTHLPTGIVVSCQSERSQHKNRSNAMRILKAKLKEMERAERDRERDAIEAAKMEIAWGSQIRSYVLQPYQKIKDHRTGFEEGNVTKVLDGGLDGLIEAYLLSMADKRKEQL